MLYFIYTVLDSDDWYTLTYLVASGKLQYEDFKEFNALFLHSNTHRILSRATYDQLNGVVPSDKSEQLMDNIDWYYTWKSFGLNKMSPSASEPCYLYFNKEQLYLSYKIMRSNNKQCCVFTKNKKHVQALYLQLVNVDKSLYCLVSATTQKTVCRAKDSKGDLHNCLIMVDVDHEKSGAGMAEAIPLLLCCQDNGLLTIPYEDKQWEIKYYNEFKHDAYDNRLCKLYYPSRSVIVLHSVVTQRPLLLPFITDGAPSYADTVSKKA